VKDNFSIKVTLLARRDPAQHFSNLYQPGPPQQYTFVPPQEPQMVIPPPMFTFSNTPVNSPMNVISGTSPVVLPRNGLDAPNFNFGGAENRNSSGYEDFKFHYDKVSTGNLVNSDEDLVPVPAMGNQPGNMGSEEFYRKLRNFK